MSYESRAVVISGGSKGIGLSIAKVIARKTSRPLVLLARDQYELDIAKEACLSEGAHKVDTVSVDITDEDKLNEIDFSLFEPGILINNAGSFLFKELEKTTAAEFKQQFEVNAFGAFSLTNQILPIFKREKQALIVNICSVGSLKGLGDSGAYSMSKHALLGYTRSLRKELMPYNIAVTAINLGQTYSTSWEEVDIDSDLLVDPEDVGKMILAIADLSPRSVVEELILMPQKGEVPPT